MWGGQPPYSPHLDPPLILLGYYLTMIIITQIWIPSQLLFHVVLCIECRLHISCFLHLHTMSAGEVKSLEGNLNITDKYHSPVKVELRKMRKVLVFTGHCSSMKPCRTL